MVPIVLIVGWAINSPRSPQTRRVFAIELLYTDHEGHQRTIGQYSIAPGKEDQWMCSMVRHWNLDRPDPR